MISSVAEALGEINARLQIIEMALAQESNTEIKTHDSVSTISHPNENAEVASIDDSSEMLLAGSLPDTVKLFSDVLSTLDNFHDTEVTENNYEYNWTGVDPVTDVELMVSREQEKELRIAIVSTLKTDAFENIRVEIDGNELSYSTYFDDELGYVSATLPTLYWQDRCNCSLDIVPVPMYATFARQVL